MSRRSTIGVSMLVLCYDDRISLMKGVVLRRLDSGKPLSREQFEVAVQADFDAIKAQVTSFSLQDYLGMDLPTFYKTLLVGQIVSERRAPATPSASPATPSGLILSRELSSFRAEASLPKEGDLVLVERGPAADSFYGALREPLQDLVDSVPMSTRGFYDTFKTQPGESQTVTVDIDEFNRASRGPGKRVIVDHNAVDESREL